MEVKERTTIVNGVRVPYLESKDIPYQLTKVGNVWSYNTVNLNIEEVKYLLSVWEMYNIDVWDNNKGAFKTFIKDSTYADKKVFISAEHKCSAETFMVHITHADRTYHIEKEHWLKIYDDKNSNMEVA